MQNLLSFNTAKQQKSPHPNCLKLGGDYNWIGFYNQRRPHQALGMKTPAQTYQSWKLAA
jgi:hypothetical protein